MKKIILVLQLAVFAAFLFGGGTARAQTTNYIIDAFDTSNEVSGPPWGNWFGGAFVSATWDGTVDANNNTNSGALLITGSFTGGGQQYFVFNNFGGINPPLNGTNVTNFQCDIRFDPTSCTNPFGTFGNMAFGSRGTGFGQPSFGNFSVAATNTNWVHVSLPVNVVKQPAFASIPDVTIQLHTFGAPMNGTSRLWVDNIQFVGPLVAVSNPPPTMGVEKAVPELRIFAGSTTTVFDREELTTVDQNQSWIGTNFPVTYSFTLKDFNVVNNFQFHLFLLPENFSGSPFFGNQFIDFEESNSVWLQILKGPTNVTANVSWKTNLPNANPNVVAVRITNSTAVGTWTLTFNSDTNGTLTAPGASPAPFTIADTNAVQDFGDPMVAIVGLQPNGDANGEGQFVDVGAIHINGVQGAAENQDFTTNGPINSALWDITDSVNQAGLIVVTTNTPLWVHWTEPDDGFGLETKASLTDTNVPWVSPNFYDNYGPDTNSINALGLNRWLLVPTQMLPTVNGTALSTPASNVYFRLANPLPSQ